MLYSRSTGKKTFGHGSHLGLLTWTIHINFVLSSQGYSKLSLALIGQVVSEKKILPLSDDHDI